MIARERGVSYRLKRVSGVFENQASSYVVFRFAYAPSGQRAHQLDIFKRNLAISCLSLRA